MTTNFVRSMVSKQKNRFITEQFDLDLSYITPRIIAMGFPAEKVESLYRNHIDDVARFLEQEHADHYFVYNLRNDSNYDASKFKNRVHSFTMDDHHPPPLNLFQPFCEDVHSWLTKNEKNIIAVHCKAGKGRTGVMICAYLLYSGHCKTPKQALEFYGNKRTKNGKGVTIPSQRRYVDYFHRMLLSNDHRTKKVHMLIKGIYMYPSPFQGTHDSQTSKNKEPTKCAPYFIVYCGGKPVYRSQVYTPETQNRNTRAPNFSIAVATNDTQTTDGSRPYSTITPLPPNIYRNMSIPAAASNQLTGALDEHRRTRMPEMGGDYAKRHTTSQQAGVTSTQSSATGTAMVLPINHTLHTLVADDVRVDVYNKNSTSFKSLKGRKNKLFHFWFNTFFVCNEWESKCADPSMKRVASTKLSHPSADTDDVNATSHNTSESTPRRCVSDSTAQPMNYTGDIASTSPKVSSTGHETDDGYHSTGSGSLIESIRKQRQADENEFTDLFGQVPDGHHLLTLRKHELDTACKDNKHQRFDPNFRVYVMTRCVSDDELKKIVNEQRRYCPEPVSSASLSTTSGIVNDQASEAALCGGLYMSGRAPHEPASSSDEDDTAYAQLPLPSCFEPSTMATSSCKNPCRHRSPSPHKCPLWAIPSAFAYTQQEEMTSQTTTPSVATANPNILADIHFSSSSDDEASDENIDYVGIQANLQGLRKNLDDDGNEGSTVIEPGNYTTVGPGEERSLEMTEAGDAPIGTSIYALIRPNSIPTNPNEAPIFCPPPAMLDESGFNLINENYDRDEGYTHQKRQHAISRSRVNAEGEASSPTEQQAPLPVSREQRAVLAASKSPLSFLRGSKKVVKVVGPPSRC